jgi:hypothetical protein
MQHVAIPFAVISASGFLTGAQYAPHERPAGTDGQYHPTVETSQTFECGTNRAGLKYRQERVPEEEASRLDQGFRVTLLELSVSGRSVSRVDLENGRAFFRGFAWIQDVSAMCYRGRVTINVRGMPLRPYLASLNNDRIDDTPELRTRSIRLGPRGLEYISLP